MEECYKIYTNYPTVDGINFITNQFSQQVRHSINIVNIIW